MEDQDRLRLALAAARLGEWSWDSTNDVVTLSERAAEIFGLPADETVTWTQMLELLHHDDRERTRLSVQASIADRVDYVAEYRIINGPLERWIAVSGQGLYGEDGHPRGMLGFVHDRTRERTIGALDELLRPLSEAGTITATAASFLGRALRVHRCAYAPVEADEDTFTIIGDYVDGVESLVGVYRFRDFSSSCLRLLRAGQPFVVSARRNDPRLHDADPSIYGLTGIEAVICVPLHKAGRFVAAMACHYTSPRLWSKEEVELVQAVASRCWESLERARIEHSLRENDERYRALLESAGQIFWTAAPDGRVIKDSSSWRAFTGQTEEQWQGVGWLDALHPEDRVRLESRWKGAADKGQPIESEYRIRHRDGGYRWTSVRVVPIINGDGSIREWFGMNTDITPRKVSERRDALLVRIDDFTRPLTEPAEIAQTVLRLLCEELGADRATLFEIDPEGHAGNVLADYAPRLVALQGVYPLDEYGRDFARAVRSGSTYQLEDIAQADLSDEERQRFASIQIGAELMVPLHKAGSLKATVGLFQGTPRRWPPDEVQLCHLVVQRCWDSLERARIEGELRFADKRKDEFIATLAHELRNPLAPIRNGLALLRRSPDPALRARSETMMERQVDHLVRMVDDLLDVSRITRGLIELQIEEVVLQDVLQRAIEASLPALQAAMHDLRIELPSSPVWVRGDSVRLTQVFSNLLNNAAKFTDPRGVIAVRLTEMDQAAIATVEDNGIGIPSSLLHEIFELFAQGPNAKGRGTGGLGIGLSLARRLVAMHGGQVTASSAGPGKGSVLEVRLPVMAAPSPPDSMLAASADEEGPHGTVLVVDDNRDAADSTAALLGLQGWDASAMYEGEAALEVLRHRHVDVALIDLGMPVMDGYELARRIRNEIAGPPLLVALTGWGQPGDRARSRQAGFDEHLVKPVQLSTLMRLLEDRVASRR